MRKRKTQSILEYVLVLTAIIIVVIAATVGIGGTNASGDATPTSGAMVQDAVNQMYSDATDLITRETGSFLSLGGGVEGSLGGGDGGGGDGG